MDSGRRFEKIFEVRYSEIDGAMRLTPVALFNYMQEAAVLHSRSRNLSPTDMIERGVTWVLMRFHMRVERYPAWQERVHVRTWPSNLKGLFAIREFDVRDDQGATLCAGASQWIVLDIARRRPVRIPRWITDGFQTYPDRLIDDPFDELPAIDRGDFRRSFHVRLSDLDQNQHANSSSYIDWLIESAPSDIHKTHQPRSIEIAYKHEALAGEALVAESKAEPTGSGPHPGFLHLLRREDDGTVLAVARSDWVQIPGDAKTTD